MNDIWWLSGSRRVSNTHPLEWRRQWHARSAAAAAAGTVQVGAAVEVNAEGMEAAPERATTLAADPSITALDREVMQCVQRGMNA